MRPAGAAFPGGYACTGAASSNPCGHDRRCAISADAIKVGITLVKTATEKFCALVLERSREHAEAFERLCQLPAPLIAPCFGILRQELDSMVRVIFLLSITDLDERRQLIQSTLDGSLWQVATQKGKFRRVTDREMVELAQHLQGWTQSVYKFGCAFIHLSNFHNHLAENPFETLSDDERRDVLAHMRFYHGGPNSDRPTMADLGEYLPRVFEKVRGNLEYYLEELPKESLELY
jgi:hypothetical protein